MKSSETNTRQQQQNENSSLSLSPGFFTFPWRLRVNAREVQLAHLVLIHLAAAYRSRVWRRVIVLLSGRYVHTARNLRLLSLPSFALRFGTPSCRPSCFWHHPYVPHANATFSLSEHSTTISFAIPAIAFAPRMHKQLQMLSPYTYFVRPLHPVHSPYLFSSANPSCTKLVYNSPIFISLWTNLAYLFNLQARKSSFLDPRKLRVKFVHDNWS